MDSKLSSPATPSKVLILGAQGRFGAAAAQSFAQDGWQVVAQVRRSLAATPAGVSVANIDLADTAALAAAAAGASVVVHAVNPPYTDWNEQLLPLARLGMDLAQHLGATFMLPGNVYNFGQRMPALLNENTPQQASTGKGRLRVALEQEMRARASQGLRCVVIRAGDFYGAGLGSWFDLVIAKSLARGKLVYPGPLDRLHAWAYLPDLAQAFVQVACRRETLAPFTNLHFAGHTVSGAQFLDAVERAAAALGVKPAKGFRRAGLPWGLIRVGGLLVPTWRELATMAYLWDVPHGLDGSALQSLVGKLPATPLDDAIQQALRELAHGREAAAGPAQGPMHSKPRASVGA